MNQPHTEKQTQFPFSENFLQNFHPEKREEFLKNPFYINDIFYKEFLDEDFFNENLSPADKYMFQTTPLSMLDLLGPEVLRDLFEKQKNGEKLGEDKIKELRQKFKDSLPDRLEEFFKNKNLGIDRRNKSK